MEKRIRRQLGWLDKLAIKHGSLFLTALTIAIPMYTRFVSAERQLDELRKSVDKLSVAVTALNDQLGTEKTNTAMMSLRISILEQQIKSAQPRLLK